MGQCEWKEERGGSAEEEWDFQYSDHTSYRQLESFVHRMMMMHGNLMNFMN